VGAPSSGIIAEIFVQHIEQAHMTHLNHKYNNIIYFCYVYDILLIFDTNHHDIKAVLKDLNALHPASKSTVYNKSRKRQHSNLPGYIHSQNS